MLCFLALIVFAALSLFSAKYRPLAKEAFKCVFLKMTLRPCEGALDVRLKAETTKLFMFYPPLAAVIFKQFELFSILLTILMLASFAYSLYGIYAYVVYGNCNGPDSNEFCPFGIIGSALSPSAGAVSDTGNPYGNQSAAVRVVEFGCMSCKYTKLNEPAVARLLVDYGTRIKYVFKTSPIPTHNYSYQMALAAECAGEQNKFWAYKDKLFSRQEDIVGASSQTAMESILYSLASDMGIGNGQFRECYASKKYSSKIDLMITESKEINLYATPTFIINNQAFVGVQTYETLRDAVDKELAKK
ncbi:hypothetical protein COT30_03735 [Candidatus Micrarchaeota archaeon CG08_land_8_20_14_0_20_49_17]|nr:MAG: hypothetical protein AUJ13_05310 [Candidatus Micrarchaeota archaeon CG1_02_49_24]PIU09568.1 MAG: hypothetical protein COT30_03735 [Candidatus Micrarchaeota archaeon CG08_land_8_20_14_0_20_49_17]PIU81420.1 MAG: hypothetical protein COS70_04210 [Candidatus Micrarchaeota archaeon CG06_land_8_20_14_3_00_50_6]PIZ92187.1 MAG: hypothetical protein COX84_07245 [Candidatus Micrarchaeota archaeon CG_4_10_14_0_2_um_filter_49_7]HII54430.1 thioredoxin domain-containing protein [Candidatus Micrarchae